MQTNQYPTKATAPAVQQNPSRLREWVWELILTLAVVALLAVIANPLAKASYPLGLNERYAATQPNPESASSKTHGLQSGRGQALTDMFDFAPAESDKRLRAQWLNRHAGMTLTLLALFGWAALTLGRLISDTGTKLPSIGALWCLTGHALAAFSARTNLVDLGISVWLLSAAVLALIAAWNAGVLLRKSPSLVVFLHATSSRWIYPGFVLFSGLGWLWLLDLAARGHLDKQFIGIYQLDALFIAYGVLTVVAAHEGPLLAAVTRMASRLGRIGMRYAQLPDAPLLGLLLVWVALLAIVGQQVHHLSATGKPVYNYQANAALLSELMRIPAWFILGWICYRWLESGQRALQGVAVAALMVVILMLGMRLNHDNGPILTLTIAAIRIFAGIVYVIMVRNGMRSASWPTACALVTGGTAMAVWLAFLGASQERLDAMALKYSGPLDFLSVLHWMFDSTPAFGFGLTKAPWCGYQVASGVIDQCRRYGGVPDQVQSDYSAAAIFFLWGMLVTVLLIGALMLWLWELLRKGPTAHREVMNLSLLRHWLVTGFAITSGVQVVVSVLGTTGQIPLSGVGIPLLSLGGVGLCSAALFTGLSVNQIYFRNPDKQRVRGTSLKV